MSTTDQIRTSARRWLKYVKTTLIGGLVIVVPLFALAWLGKKAVGLLQRMAKPLDDLLPMDTVWGVVVADAIAVALLLGICFVAGLLTRFSFANRFVKKAESGVLWRIPGYGFLKALTDSLDKKAAASSMRPVMIRFDDSSQLAFEVDRLADGRCVIYIPSAPDPRAGTVVVMDADRVEAVPLTFMKTLGDLRALGRGLGADLSPPARLTERQAT